MDTKISQKVRDLVSKDQTATALKMLKEYVIESDNEKDIVKLITLQESNFTLLRRNQMLGSIDSNEFNVGVNKIKVNILDIVEALESGRKNSGELLLSQSRSKNKKYSTFGLVLILFILFSSLTKYSVFRVFSNSISIEKTKSDLLGKSVCYKRDSCWIFISKDNFNEFELINEKVELDNYEKTIRMKLEDARTKNFYHMKLFLRYSYDVCYWQLENTAVLEYYKIE